MSSIFDNQIMTRTEKVSYFTSKHFLDMITRMVRIYCRNHNLNIVPSSTTCTDGTTIYENFNNETFLDETLDKTTTTMCYFSDVFHENGHLEESCFEIVWAINKPDDWNSSFLTTKEKRLIEKYVSSYAKKLTAYERHALADINNIVEDSAMEYRQGIKKGDFVTKCFKLGNVIVMNARPSLNELKEKNVSPYKILVEAILCYSIIHYTKGTIEDEDLKIVFENELMPLCKKGKLAKTPLDRFLVAKEMFEILLPYLKELEKESKSPYQNISKSSKQGTPSSEKNSQNAESDESTENSKNKGSNKNQTQRQTPDISPSENNETSSSNDANGENSQKENNDYAKDDFDGIIEELSEENKNSISNEIKQGLRAIDACISKEKEEKMDSMNESINFSMMSGKSKQPMGSSCIDTSVNIEASCPLLENGVLYEKIVREYSSLISIFISYFENLLKPTPARRIYSSTGSKIGTMKLAQYKFNPNIYVERVNKKCLPPFSIVLLIDVSGSMLNLASQTGETRLDMAIRAAVILNEVFHHLNIPFAIITHSASYPIVEMKCYKNFNSRYEERYKIGAISTSSKCSANRDGVAIRFINEFISSRTDNPIVLSLSDGNPNDSGYRGQAAIEDTKKAVDKLALQTKVIGVSIANNEEDFGIKSIYSNNIIVPDLNSLATELLNLII